MWRTLNLIVWQKQDLANALRRREYFSQLYAFVYIVAHLIFIYVDVVDEILVMIVIFFFNFKELGFFKDNRFVASWPGFGLIQKPFNSPLIKALLLCYKLQRNLTKTPPKSENGGVFENSQRILAESVTFRLPNGKKVAKNDQIIVFGRWVETLL